MKKTYTLSLVTMFSLMLVFTSCDLTNSEEIRTLEEVEEVSFRFQNISDVDIQSISATFGHDVEALNAGEATEYISINRLVVDEEDNITALITGEIDGVTFNNQQENSTMIECTTGCGGDNHVNTTFIKSGTYTLTIDVSNDFSEEGRNNKDVHLVTRLVAN